MPLVTLQNLTLAYRGPALLDDVSCIIQPGQRIGLLGRNGAGKTSLMNLIAETVEPDSGELLIEPGSRIAMLRQDVPMDVRGTIFEVVRANVDEHLIEHSVDHDGSGEAKPWESQNKVEQVLSRMSLDGDALFATLSSGMKRRVLLAGALVNQPDLLLLDEPTNHLDIDAIEWLERFLTKWKGTLIFVTHDRIFLQNLATRILEIDRGRLFDWSCDYQTFLRQKEEALAAEEKQNALFDKKLAAEEVWIRQGIKARRTRNEGRVRDLKKLREERTRRRERIGTSNLQVKEGERSGNLVIEAKNVCFAYDSRPIVEGFSTQILRGDKIGVIGPNGVGKTTLLRILLGQLPPTSGNVRRGVNLQVAYFDQLREQLDAEKTVLEDVGDGYDHIQVGSEKQHVIGYLQNFLFTPERSRTLVKFLSGGERNRILLAKLFSKPANVIVLDEPTNDLDAETLEMLEERLVAFEGTALVVSHDRAFLNNVVTSTIVFEKTPGGKTVNEYVGGYHDWIRQRPAFKEAEPKSKKSRQLPKPESLPPKPGKLKYKERKELDALPDKIEQLDAQIAEAHQQLADPDFFRQSGEAIAAEQRKLVTLEAELAAAYKRWEELEGLVE
jgi:ATP-binding cassette subfamily F protein uup